MKVYDFLLLMLLMLSIRCVSKRSEEKTFKMKIDPPSRIVRVLDVGRGDCLLVFKRGDLLDTIPFYRHNPFARQIDTLSMLNKESNCYNLKIKNLRRKDDSRYDSIFRLFYW